MIGLFGGTFDPIHHGHLRSALEVTQELQLEQMRFIPLRDPPHRGKPRVSGRQRLEMITAAIASEPGFVADDRELLREGKSYTVDTLKSLREEFSDVPLLLMLGSDAFRGFPAWYKPEEILELAHLLVVQRPGEVFPGIYSDRVLTNWQDARLALGGRILVKSVTQLQISSTQIREMIRKGLSPRYLVPDPVLDLIDQGGYYRAP